MDEKNNEILEIVTFMKDNMVTKSEFKEELGGVKEEIGGLKEEMRGVKDRLTAVEGKVNGIYNILDQHVDRAKALEVRVAKLETSKSS